MNKKGLGRGLGSLFADYNEEDSEQNIEKNSQIEIEIGKIDRNENQPRKKFDEKTIKELSESIKTYGVIQPIILSKQSSGRYILVAGERRWRAARMAGLKTIPAIIKDFDEKQISEIALVENLQRENLNAIESAKGIQELINKYNYTQEQASDRIGKSRSAVTNTLRLLSLCPEVQKLIEEDKLSAGHARVLVVLTDKDAQMQFAKLACEGKLSVRQMEKSVKDFLSSSAGESKQKPVQSAEIKDFASRMGTVFSTKVTILGNEKRGRIFIDYYNTEDLNRINSIINKIK